MKATSSMTMQPRNWIGYICDALVSSGAMPTWDAATYLTQNLFGDSPNARLHQTKAPYEAISQFLHRVYSPIVEAAARAVTLPPAAMLHVFTDISVMSNSAVLVVYFPGENHPHRLLLLDAARAWELVFEDDAAFNAWAEERYRWIEAALIAASAKVQAAQPEAVSV
jgi:hypothetical protein